MAAAWEPVLFVVLEYSIRGIWLSLPSGNTNILNFVCVLKRDVTHKKKTEMLIKNPCALTDRLILIWLSTEY